MQSKNKWKSQLIQKKWKNKHRSHKRYHQKRNNGKYLNDIIYSKDITLNFIKQTQRSPKSMNIDITVNVNFIKNCQSNDCVLWNVNVDIFDHSKTNHWTSYTFIPCFMYCCNQRAVFKITNNVKYQNDPNWLIKIADTILCCRIPLEYKKKHFNNIEWRIYSEQMNNILDKKKDNDFKQLLHGIIKLNEMWAIYDTLFEFIGYKNLYTVTLKAFIGISSTKNTISAHDRIIMKKHTPFKHNEFKPSMITILDENNDENVITLKSKIINDKLNACSFNHYYNVPFTPKTKLCMNVQIELCVNGKIWILFKSGHHYDGALIKDNYILPVEKQFHFQTWMMPKQKIYKICNEETGYIDLYYDCFHAYCEWYYDSKQEKWVKGKCCHHYETCACQCLRSCMYENYRYYVTGSGCNFPKQEPQNMRY